MLQQKRKVGGHNNSKRNFKRRKIDTDRCYSKSEQ